MTVENFKKLSALLIAVFAMAAVYEFSNIPDDKERLPLIFSISSNKKLDLKEEEIYNPCGYMEYECTVQFMSNETEYSYLLDILYSLPTGYIKTDLPEDYFRWSISRGSIFTLEHQERNGIFFGRQMSITISALKMISMKKFQEGI